MWDLWSEVLFAESSVPVKIWVGCSVWVLCFVKYVCKGGCWMETRGRGWKDGMVATQQKHCNVMYG